MKKYFLFLLAFFKLFILDAQEWNINFLEDIDEKYLGVYLPVNFIELLQDSNNFTLSLMTNYDQKEKKRLYHDILIIDKNRNMIWSNARFHDGYAIKLDEAEKYKFIEKNNEILIIDNKEYEYLKISTDIENAYEIVDKFIAGVVFSKAIERRKVFLENDIVIIADTGLKYKMLLTQFVQGYPNIILRGNQQEMYLEIIDGKYIFFDTIRLNPMYIGKGNNIIYEF